jgi:hypothetical protein
MVVTPGSYEQFASSVVRLLRDEGEAERMGRDARAYAESAFDAAGIAVRVTQFIAQCSGVATLT